MIIVLANAPHLPGAAVAAWCLLKRWRSVRRVVGGSYTTEFRLYDVRVGRWLSLDGVIKAE